MSQVEDTQRSCRYCGKVLVRKEINRTRQRPGIELEPPRAFARRRHCNAECRRNAERSMRPPRPVCACGCGVLTSWRGPSRDWSRYAPGCYRKRRLPPHPPWVDNDPAFWDWFAGFTDGEGCFGITRSHTGGGEWPQPFFKIAVRADERPILEEIKSRLGCGRVSVHVPGSSTSNLQLKYELTSLADCERLIEVLRAHPLRAKKRHDFDIWAAAVLEKATNGTGPRVWELREKLMAGRQYDPRIALGGDAK